MREERIWILLAKKKCGEASSKELEELEYLMRENESVLFSEDILDKLWKAPLRTQSNTQNSSNWSRIGSSIERKENKKRQLKWWWSAAAIVGLLGLTFYFIQVPQQNHTTLKKTSSLNKIVTPEETRLKIELPDGSIVWINEDSRLTYNSTTFGKSDREVSLEGEAYFEIHGNAQLPFVVHAERVDIKVLGTTFNVKAYKKDKAVEATLISGKIAVSMKSDPEKKVILRPDEKIVIPKSRSKVERVVNNHQSFKVIKVEKDKTGLVKATEWMRHRRLVFDNETFEKIAVKMEKWYGIEIRFANDSLKQLHFSGIIEDETLSEAISALRLSRYFKFCQKDNIVWVGKVKK